MSTNRGRRTWAVYAQIGEANRHRVSKFYYEWCDAVAFHDMLRLAADWKCKLCVDEVSSDAS